MADRDTRNQVAIDEPELVNNSEGKNTVYKVDVAYKEPVFNSTRTGYDFRLFDAENNLIGVKDSKGRIEIFPEYKILLESMGVDLDSTELVVEDREEGNQKKLEEEERQIEESRQQEENERLEQERAREQAEELKKKREQDPTIPQPTQNNEELQIEEEDNVHASSTKINHKDLMKHPKYKDITAWTMITDSEFLDSVQGIKAHSPQIDRGSIIVAEMNGEFKVLAKALGTDEIIDLTPEARQVNNSAEEVNRIEGNTETLGGRQYTMKLPVFDNQEIAIRKTATGQIELERIADIDGERGREAINIGTSVTHPTREESERAKYEKYGYDFSDNDGQAFVTLSETERIIDELIRTRTIEDADEMQSIRDEVIQYVNTSSENPTYSRLEELVDSAQATYEQQQEEEKEEEEKEEQEQEREEDEYNGDWLPGMSSRRRNRI